MTKCKMPGCNFEADFDTYCVKHYEMLQELKADWNGEDEEGEPNNEEY